MKEVTVGQRVREIEMNLSRVYVLSDRYWRLYFYLKPKGFVAYNRRSDKSYDLGGNKVYAAKYFNKIIQGKALPSFVREI